MDVNWISKLQKTVVRNELLSLDSPGKVVNVECLVVPFICSDLVGQNTKIVASIVTHIFGV